MDWIKMKMSGSGGEACSSGPTGPTTMKPIGPTTVKPTTAPVSSSCDCGKANKKTKIVNGVETEENEYTWQVGLKAVGGGGMLVFCGGSIISKKDLLTAAHCTQNTQPGDIYIWVGGHN